MMKSIIVHLMNKYPTCRVIGSETQIRVEKEHELILLLEKNGHGQFVDKSADIGSTEVFCLSPIPKNCRAYKLFPDGKIGKSEEYIERRDVALKVAKKSGSIPSLKELKDSGIEIKDDSVVLEKVSA